ncbi:MAG: thiolase family protein [Deltaproteobacteria bacterium]|nr:thiolase family protein [Deltaproteobacteria bacterium]
MPDPVYLAGGALTPFGKAKVPLVDLLAEAAARALAEAAVTGVDAMYLGVMNAEEFTGEGNLAALLADRLGLSGVPSSRVETASSTGAGVLESAFFAVASGYRQNVLVVAGEKMTGHDTARTTRILAEVIAPDERRYGASMPALAALVSRAYAHAHRLDHDTLRRVLGLVAVKNHARGALNPYAQFQRAITLEKHHAARLVADPLGLFDCAPITDGAAAVVLCGRKGQVRLAGIGHATDSAEVCRRGSLVGFNSTRQAAAQAYQMARVTPAEVEVAEVHDAFTMFEVIGSEDLGLFAPGQGWQAVLEGRTGPEGSLPINPSGGLKARGHPVGASGLAQVVEAYWLLTGQVRPEQKLPRQPRVALTHSIGGLGNNNLVTILVPAKRPMYPVGPWRSAYSPRPDTPAPPRPRPEPPEVAGRVLSSTVLHSPPEGFPSPLGLLLVEAREGWRTLALAPGDGLAPVGERVRLVLEEGRYHLVPGREDNMTVAAFKKAVKLFPSAMESLSSLAKSDRKKGEPEPPAGGDGDGGPA